MLPVILGTDLFNYLYLYIYINSYLYAFPSLAEKEIIK